MRKLLLTTLSTLIFSTTFLSNTVLAKTEETNNFISTMATIHITGSVNKPGIYKVPTGMRLVDVLSKAGGLKKEAYINDINLTQSISDGTTIHIANKQEVQKITQTTNIQMLSNNKKTSEKVASYDTKVEKKHKGQSKASNKNITSKVLVNLNRASEEELSSLPGVGEKLAKNIVIYRKKHGGFKSIEDLKNIERVGNKKFNKLKNRVTV